MEDLKEEHKKLYKLFQDHDKIIAKQNEDIRELVLVIMGDEKLNIEGILTSQRKDNELRGKIYDKMESIQKDLNNHWTELDKRIRSLESYTSTIDTFIKIAGNSKFWRFLGWIVLILAISYATMTDKLKDLIHFMK